MGPGARVGDRFVDGLRPAVLTDAAEDAMVDEAKAAAIGDSGAPLDSELPLLFSLFGEALLLPLEEVPLLLRGVSRAYRFFFW